MTAPLASDFVFDLPFSARSNHKLIHYILPAMTILQLFYPDQGRDRNSLRLEADETIKLHYDPRPRGRLERHLAKVFRGAGYIALTSFCRYVPAGSSYHYAGTLPMRREPQTLYETHSDGRLHGTNTVHVADAATFPELPSKNLTLTIMANALRIGDLIRSHLR
ncbi:MAG: GMC family oxidoreductase [Thermoanaerobaculia bacterium]|nr:GMC family oxidoreductase [Thermoanaerobaculia bacterium]